MTSSNPNAAHLYAQVTAYRTLWANTRSPIEREKYLEAGKTADLALVDVPITGPADAVIKLASAIDWLSEDASEPALRMLESVLEYLKSDCGIQKKTKPSKTQKSPAKQSDDEFFADCLARARLLPFDMELAKKAMADKKPKEKTYDRSEPVVARSKNIIVDRRMRPTWVDGVLYPSTSAAARALKITHHAIRKMASTT